MAIRVQIVFPPREPWQKEEVILPVPAQRQCGIFETYILQYHAEDTLLHGGKLQGTSFSQENHCLEESSSHRETT
jgi:hypothetical protein